MAITRSLANPAVQGMGAPGMLGAAAAGLMTGAVGDRENGENGDRQPYRTAMTASPGIMGPGTAGAVGGTLGRARGRSVLPAERMQEENRRPWPLTGAAVGQQDPREVASIARRVLLGGMR